VAGVNRFGLGATASGAGVGFPIFPDAISPDDRAACTHRKLMPESLHHSAAKYQTLYRHWVELRSHGHLGLVR
jgi:hypothetical protein